MEPTIITLAPLEGQEGGITTVISSTFEEAFGEYSEMRGRGRKRRNTRKTERQQNRIGRRRLRKKSRQEIRDDQEESKQGRKTRKKGHKLRRKSMGDQEHGDEQRPDEEPRSEPRGDESSSSSSQEQPSEYGQSSQQSDSSQEQPRYEESQEQSNDDSQNDDSQNDDSQSDDQSSDDQSSSDSDSGFDGIMGAEDRFSEMNDEGAVRVRPEVKDVAKKIEWNKEMISRLRKRSELLKAKLPTERNQAVKSQMIREIAEIAHKAKECIDRVHELESKLTKYTNFEGDFSGADGEFSEARGRSRGKSSHSIKGRHREVTKAKKEARHERHQVSKDKHKEKKHTHAGRHHGGCETPIEGGLNAEMSEQRIEIPAVSNFSNATGTGLNGLDLQNDFDAPPARIFELKSNADGDKPTAKKLNYKAIAVGVGVALVAIWAIKKYNILGSK